MTGWFSYNGVGFHWREDGDQQGPPILFLNSLGTDLRLWDAIVEQFPDARLIRMDMRGHGLSDAPKGPYSLSILAADVAELIRYLKLSRLTVVGVSLGGMLAQALAAEHADRIERLVLSNTAMRMGTSEMWAERIALVESGGIVGIADAILERWFAPAFRCSPDVAPWRNMLTRSPEQGYTACCAALAKADLSATSRHITCPTQVIGGSEDGSSPPEIVRALAEAIPGASFDLIEGVGHLPMVEAPEVFTALLRDFLQETADA